MVTNRLVPVNVQVDRNHPPILGNAIAEVIAIIPDSDLAAW